MDDSDDFEVRNDPKLEAALLRGVETFKYLSAVCWAPVVVILPLVADQNASYGYVFKTLATLITAMLVFSGSIFFLAYIKQSNSLNHQLMGRKALEHIGQVNPNANEVVASNAAAGQRLGHLADKYGFPFMTLSYALIAIVALFSIWI